MSSSNPTLGAVRETRRANPAVFVVLIVLSLALAGFALYKGQAPIRTPYPEDWIIWARGTSTWAGALALGVVILLIGVIGLVISLLPSRPQTHDHYRPRTTAPAGIDLQATSVADLQAPDLQATDLQAVDLQTATRSSENRGALRFNAENVAAMPVSSVAEPIAPSLVYTTQSFSPTEPTPEPATIEASPITTVAPVHTGPTYGVPSLEPAIFSDHTAFSDNASDSFMTRLPEEPVMATAEVPAFDASAAFSDTHGLHIHAPAQPVTAEIVPIRPDVIVPAEATAVEAVPETAVQAPPEQAHKEQVPQEAAQQTIGEETPQHDPLAAALLAETPDVVTQAPPGDINAVINSTMRFAPKTELPGEIPAAVAATAASPAVTSVPDIMPAAAPVVDDETEIRQATQTALSVWPEATRAIAADELSARIAHLYYDKSPASQQAFQQIAAGDLSGAAASLANQADALALAGNHAAAAELWRVSGALHMGRDDARAMAAYEHVSELDPNDANIHLYLARRYQMSGDTAKQPAVIARALNVIADPVTRAELLAPYADLKLKAGDARTAGDALEELSRLQESDSYLRPDDVGLRSTLAITVARLAQAREIQGAFDQAGPLYRKAHKVFADLSALKPEHPGLRAMADNALRDAQRFNIA